jgi:hypothetical protein
LPRINVALRLIERCEKLAELVASQSVHSTSPREKARLEALSLRCR